MEAGQLALDLSPIDGEQGAITMKVTPHATIPGRFDVEVGSFDQPFVMVDETGVPAAMTQVSPPDGTGGAGEWSGTVVGLPDGPHAIICYNATCRVRQKVYAGDIPFWDPGAVKDNTFAGRQETLREDIAQIKQATPTLNG
jgi:hypothetical protein